MNMPWRYLIPRGGYFKSLHIARCCPEIKRNIDLAALYAGGQMIELLLIPFVVALVVIVWLFERLAKMAVFNCSERRNKVLEDAHRILPVDEIRRRCGFEPLPKVSSRQGDAK